MRRPCVYAGSFWPPCFILRRAAANLLFFLCWFYKTVTGFLAISVFDRQRRMKYQCFSGAVVRAYFAAGVLKISPEYCAGSLVTGCPLPGTMNGLRRKRRCYETRKPVSPFFTNRIYSSGENSSFGGTVLEYFSEVLLNLLSIC